MPTSTIVACSQCCNATLFAASLEYASVSQACNNAVYAFGPCSSSPAVFEDGNCVQPAQVCSPNWDDLTRAEQCADPRYFKKTTVDLSGTFSFYSHGRTHIQEWTINPLNEQIILQQTCSGTVTQTTTGAITSGPEQAYDLCTESATGSTTVFSTTTYPADCSLATTTYTCSGSTTRKRVCQDPFGGPSYTPVDCSSSLSLQEDGSCGWEGTRYTGGYQDGLPDGYEGHGSNCFDFFPYDVTWTETPGPLDPPGECKVTNTYTDIAKQCTPETLPSYPAFNGCENDDLVDPPELASGQGYNSEAYFYEQPSNKAYTSKQSVQYRAAFPPPNSCYLKIWFRHRVQKWKFEDCDTGFSGDPPRTGAWSIDCTEEGSPCTHRWSTDGPPTYVNTGFFEWTGAEFPCLNDLQAPANACVNKIYSPAYTLVAAKNTSVQVEWKTSINVNHPEPAWP